MENNVFDQVAQATDNSFNVLNTTGAAARNAPQNDFWYNVAVDHTAWNKSMPYRLLLVVPTEDGGYAISKSQGNNVFVLPIPPESLSISTPFAINVAATLNGIVEEHNAAPFRIINIQGTTGVAPLKGFVKQPNTYGYGLGGIWGGTVDAINNVGTAFTGLAGQGRIVAKPDLMPKEAGHSSTASPDYQALATTGYAQFHLLRQFLENYAALKKTDKGRNIRLCFAAEKDHQYWLVTPVLFDLARSKESPLEYPYRLQFKAWRRIAKPSENSSIIKAVVNNPRSPSGLARALNAISAAREILTTSYDVLESALNEPVDAVLDTLREVTLFVKTGLGIAASVADMPNSIASRIINEFSGAAAGIRSSWDGTVDAWANESWSTLGGIVDKHDAVTGYTANNLTKNPQTAYSTLSKINVSSISLSSATLRQVRETQTKAAEKSRTDFEKDAKLVENALTKFSKSVDGQTMTNQEMLVMGALAQSVTELYKLAAYGEISNQEQVLSLDYVAGLARKSGIAFTEPRSKYPVPFPYGFTLERIAARYLGDANRWMEIATLNGLRQPYVDEEGFDVALIADGNGNKVTVYHTDNLYVNQSVTIYSDTQPPERRRVLAIDKVAGQYMTVTLNGESDLSKFTKGDQAKLHAFLPDTVNSEMSIYIPSDEGIEEEEFLITKAIPGVDTMYDLIKIGGVDLLLTPEGDLAITPEGDCKLAIGLTNIVQKVMLAVSTPRGSLLQHPDYGIGIEAGTSVAEVNAQELLDDAKRMFESDPTFAGVENAAIIHDGGVVRMSFVLVLARTGNRVPVAFEVGGN